MNEEAKAAHSTPRKRKKSALTVREITVFAMLGTLMYCSKLVMEWAPNIHLTAMFITAITVVYRAKALIPIYIFVLLALLFGGFSPFMAPYLYVWTVLWGVVMLLPRRMKPALAAAVYIGVCTLHGLLFGVLYAPLYALLAHLTREGMLAWIAAGFYFDILHAAGNFAAGFLILPMIKLLLKLEKRKS